MRQLASRLKKNKKERIHLGIFILTTIFVLGVIVFQMKDHLKMSNLVKNIPALGESSEVDLQNLLAQQNSDLDGDGISDFEEQTVYGTSPYLKDTDSDGFSDLAEIQAGEDPLCAKGDDCSKQQDIAPSAETNNVLPNSLLSPDLQGLGVGLDNLLEQGQNLDWVKRMQAGQLTPDELRSMLQTFGLSPQELQGIDDATLQELYKKTIQDLKNKEKQK